MRNLKAEVVRNAAKLKGWDVILRDLCPEIDSRAFDKPGRHTKCPVHGVAGRGGDGFKFFRKDFQDSGGGMCNTCGTYPDGFSLLMWVKNYGFADAVADVGDFLGIRSTEDENQQEKVNRANEQALAARRKEIEEKEAASNLYHSKKLNELWKGSIPLTHPDAEPARLYLASRKILCWIVRASKGWFGFIRASRAITRMVSSKVIFQALSRKLQRQGSLSRSTGTF